MILMNTLMFGLLNKMNLVITKYIEKNIIRKINCKLKLKDLLWVMVRLAQCPIIMDL